jgi:hypothetical protein
MSQTIRIVLTATEAADLFYMLSHRIDDHTERLADIGKDFPYSDPDERDEIIGCVKREMVVAQRLLDMLPEPPRAD